MATGDAFEQFETLLRENIESAVENLILPDDDVSWQLINTFQPTSVGGKDTDGNAGFEASWRVRVQSGGLVTGGTMAGNTITMLGAGSNLPMQQAADAKYPDPAQAPMRGWLKMRMLLKRLRGVTTINKTQIWTQLATDPIEEVAAGHIEDVVALVRHYITNYFWGDGGGALAQVNNASGYTILEATPVEVAISGGTPLRFKKGQRYQAGSTVAYANFGAATRTQRTGALNGVFRCVSDPTKDRTLFFQSEPGEGDISLTHTDDLLMHGTFDWNATYVVDATGVSSGSNVPNGVESLLPSTGNYPGTSYAVTSYPELAAYVEGSETNLEAPEPTVLAEFTDAIADLGLTPPNVAIAERSIWTLWSQLEREGFSTYQVPQGGAFTASGGISGPILSHQEFDFHRLHSAKMRPNMLLVTDPTTWKKFMPIGNGAIQWYYRTGTMAGTSSIFGPVVDGRQVTDMAQAPYDAFVEFGQTHPRRSIRRLGLKARRDL